MKTTSQHKMIILIGPPGSGKGTQAEILRAHFHFTVIAGGDIARNIAKSTPPQGHGVTNAMKHGELIPDETMNEAVLAALDSHFDQSFLFDGYPRTLNQAQFLSDLIEQRFTSHCLLVINLDLSDKDCLNRIQKRLICPECQHVVYPDTAHLQEGDPCPICGTALIRRTDDTTATILDRLKTYHHEITPILQFFRAKGCLFLVDAKPDIAKVTTQIERIINEQ